MRAPLVDAATSWPDQRVKEFARYCAVGLSGYFVNLAIFAAGTASGLHYLPAATCSFVVAATSNYALNSRWTFSGQPVSFWRWRRFLIVSAGVLGVNLAVLAGLVAEGAPPIVAQIGAIALVAPIGYMANRRWSFGSPGSER